MWSAIRLPQRLTYGFSKRRVTDAGGNLATFDDPGEGDSHKRKANSEDSDAYLGVSGKEPERILGGPVS